MVEANLSDSPSDDRHTTVNGSSATRVSLIRRVGEWSLNFRTERLKTALFFSISGKFLAAGFGFPRKPMNTLLGHHAVKGHIVGRSREIFDRTSQREAESDQVTIRSDLGQKLIVVAAAVAQAIPPSIKGQHRHENHVELARLHNGSLDLRLENPPGILLQLVGEEEVVGQLLALKAHPGYTDANGRMGCLQVSDKGRGLDFPKSSNRKKSVNRSMLLGLQQGQPVLKNRLTSVEYLVVCKLSTPAQKRFSKFFLQE